MWQLRLSTLSEAERKVAEQIIGNLDSSGYLAATVEEIGEQEKVSHEVVEKVLAKIQEFDPPGIAARDLKECLMAQAKVLGVQNALVETIIRDHLHDLETKNYNNIAKKLKIPLADILDAIFLISRMDPKPGLVYSDEGPQYIIPDVFVFKVSDEYKIILNDEGLPRLRISNFYREILGGGSEGAHERRRVQKIYQGASPVGHLAHQEHPAAPANHLPGHGEYRQIPAGILRPGDPVSEAPGVARRRR